METKHRSILKATLWTLLGLIMMTLVGVALTGSATLGGTMALINAVLGFLTYLAYERIWAGIRWGRL